MTASIERIEWDILEVRRKRMEGEEEKGKRERDDRRGKEL